VWELLAAAIQLRPLTAELNYDAALAALDCGKLDKAAVLAEEAVAMAPNWVDARNLQSKVQRRQEGKLRPA
jgi:hypothetical protein